MISLFIFLFILGLLIIVHEFGHFIIAKRLGVRVEKFSLGFGRQLWVSKKGDTEYSISALPLGGYVKLAGDNLEEYKGAADEYLALPPGKRFWIIFFGPLLNYILGFLFFWVIFFAGYPTLTTKVGGLVDGFGAKEAGVQINDVITSIDGKKVSSWEELQNIVQAKNGSSRVKISILRNNEAKEIEVSVKEKEVGDALGQKRNVGLLGVMPSDEIIKVRHGLFQSFFLSINKTASLTVLTYRAIWRMVTGRLSMRESMTGPLGIFFITSKAASLGIIALLHLVAVLSISLGIFNLFPLPILDGGHIALLGLEKIRGKYLSLRTERIITRIGVTLIITLAVIVTYNDLMRLFGAKIAKFIK
jgi:regulator of sigma E protease